MRHIFEDLADWVKVLGLVIAYAAVTFLMGAFAHADNLRQGSFLTDEVSFGDHTLRTGLYLEQGEMKACVLYLEGLGDSIMNHEPLFRALAGHGYRTISFDYLGQGGSSGSMNETRVEDALKPSVEIGTQARLVWRHFSTERDPVRGLSCAKSKKFVVGWSTGGLSAYILAVRKWADAVVLLAPGLYPKMFVGEAARNSALLWAPQSIGFDLYPVISLRSLTRDLDRSGAHVDPVKPANPMSVPLFAKNLIFTSMLYRSDRTDVPGLALLSGDTDTYVDRAKTEKMLKTKTRFSVVSYPGALHELDNELAPVRRDVQKRVPGFFDSVLRARR